LEREREKKENVCLCVMEREREGVSRREMYRCKYVCSRLHFAAGFGKMVLNPSSCFPTIITYQPVTSRGAAEPSLKDRGSMLWVEKYFRPKNCEFKILLIFVNLVFKKNAIIKIGKNLRKLLSWHRPRVWKTYFQIKNASDIVCNGIMYMIANFGVNLESVARH
jgi:hypothetical protein